MSDGCPDDPWSRRPEPATLPVPARYHGVWQRTLLQTPEGVDTRSWVRWLQLGRWHADLRLPPDAGPPAPAQGFAGITEVQTGVQGELCTWHRLVDVQPPGPHPDVGHMSFESPQRIIETGVHGVYREVWERLPDSTGLRIALAEPAPADGRAPARLFVAGRYLMRVRPGPAPQHPDFEISFGVLAQGHWHIERSTQPALQGRSLPLRLQRTGLEQAHVTLPDQPARPWRLLEWAD
ncbi:MAG: hypothetical protein ACK4MJ_01060 [Hylemonella sp.]